MFYHVFVKGNNAKVIPDNQLTFAMESRLLKCNWEHVWDSAHTPEKGLEYAKEEYNSFINPCRRCGSSESAGIFKGIYFVPEVHNRAIPYKGHICEQCAGQMEGKWL